MPPSVMPALSSVRFSFRGNTNQANTSARTSSLRTELQRIVCCCKRRRWSDALLCRKSLSSWPPPHHNLLGPCHCLAASPQGQPYYTPSGPVATTGPCSSLLLQHLWRFTHAPPDGCRVAPASRRNPFVSFTRPSIVLFYFFFRNMNVAFIRCQPLLTAPRFRDGCCGHSAEPVAEPRSLKRLVPMRPSSGVHCPHCCSASMSRVGAERFILHLLIHPSPTLANSMHSY